MNSFCSEREWMEGECDLAYLCERTVHLVYTVARATAQVEVGKLLQFNELHF